MKRIIYITGLILILHACGFDDPSAVNKKLAKSGDALSQIDKTEADPNIQGLIELIAFEKKYENSWSTKPTNFPHSKGEIFKVFKLDCSGECFKSEFRKRKSAGVEISKEDFTNLVELLSQPLSYGNSTAACYDPKFGLIVYDKENVATEFLSICLDCNSFRTYPGQIFVNYKNESLTGFSKETRTQLRQMFTKWGIQYEGFSSLWDDKDQLEK